jgi:hypothetical protein
MVVVAFHDKFKVFELLMRNSLEHEKLIRSIVEQTAGLSSTTLGLQALDVAHVDGAK